MNELIITVPTRSNASQMQIIGRAKRKKQINLIDVLNSSEYIAKLEQLNVTKIRKS